MPLRFAGHLALWLVAVIGTWGLARLVWDFLPPTPPPQPLQERQPQSVAGMLAGRASFGSTVAAAVATPGQLLLVGTAASADPAQARALLRREGDSRLLVLALGDAVSPDLRLQQIERGQITLAGSGGELRLALPRPTSPTMDPHPDD